MSKEISLHRAIQKNQVQTVSDLLSQGYDPNSLEEDDWSALMEAAYKGNLTIVKILLEAGANVNAWGQGETALMSAASAGNREVYDYLYPLVAEDIRFIADRDAEEIFREVNLRQERAKNKSLNSLMRAVADNDEMKVERLLAKGIDVNAFSLEHRTPLSLATQFGFLQIMQMLLNAGADPNLYEAVSYLNTPMSANSPLALAVQSNQRPLSATKLLIERGADLNHIDIAGNTALFYAVDPLVISYLIEAGIDINARNHNGFTFLMKTYAFRKWSALFEITVKILKDSGASEEGILNLDLHDAVISGNTYIVHSILEKDLNQININFQFSKGITLLYQAIEKGHIEIAKLLIQFGANTKLSALLICAIKSGNIDFVRLLLDSGADANVVADYDGETSLSIAKRYKKHAKKIGNLEMEANFTRIIELISQFSK